MVEGSATVKKFDSMTDLAKLLTKADASNNIAMTAGTPGTQPGEAVRITTLEQYEKEGRPANVYTRSNDHFNYPAGVGGLLIIDCDTVISKAAFLKAINDIIPLDEVAHLYTTSSSSHIINSKTGSELAGLRGQRLYIAVEDASDIPRAGKVLFERLWLNGNGYIEIGKAGQYLIRSIIDASMWQPSKLDFISGSVCIPPLEQHRPAPEPHEGELLDSCVALRDLDAVERAEVTALINKAKDALKNEAETVRDSYAHERALVHLTHSGNAAPTENEVKQAKDNILKSFETGILTGDVLVTLGNGDQVSVGEMLDNPAKFHRVKTRDPLEPDYNNSSTVGIVYLYDGQPTLYSQAHGGRSYKLLRQPRRIEHPDGRTAYATDQTVEYLRQLPDYYDLGDQLVSIKGGSVVAFNEDLLSYELGTIAQYYKRRHTKNGTHDVLKDPDNKVVKQIISRGRGRGLKPLNAVVTAPTITATGEVVQTRGYNKATGLHLAMSEDIEPVPLFVEDLDVYEAYGELMKPFRTFNYATDLDRSVALSAILTAVVRPTLDKAPGFALDAPKQGTGKTYFCECLGLLGSGERPAMTPAIEKNENEIRKSLLSMLMKGARNIVWDNVLGHFDSSTIAALLTSTTFSARALGGNRQMELPNRALFLVTSNNITLRGDMPRRFLTCRLDTKLENPTKANRDLSALNGVRPDEYIIRNRQRLVRAAIVIIKGYLQSDAHARGGVCKDRLVSFETWDTVARQPVAWLADIMPDEGLTDPKAVIDDALARDPVAEANAELLSKLYAWSEGKPFKAAELVDAMRFDSELADSVHAATGITNQLTTRGLGIILRKRRDERAGGYVLTLFKSSPGHGNSFIVEQTKES